MLRLIGWVVAVVLFCWATVSAFSIFSELKFLVDGWTWSVDQVPISIKTVALAVGKYVSGVVGGYRDSSATMCSPSTANDFALSFSAARTTRG